MQGIANDEFALGFIPFAYYAENKDRLKLVRDRRWQARERRRRRSCRAPRRFATGTYQPLSRPVFIYVSKKAAERPEVQKFVEFYLANGEKLVRGSELRRPRRRRLHDGRRAHFAKRATGSHVRRRGHQSGMTIEQLLSKERAQ